MYTGEIAYPRTVSEYRSGAVKFLPGGIFSKHGFDDGDLLVPFLLFWSKERGLHRGPNSWRFLDSHILLFEAYRRFVELPGWEPVMFASTVHNPVRAACEWSGAARSSSEPRDAAGPVLVSCESLVALADELFPRRSEGWISLYNSIHELWCFSSGDRRFLVEAGLATPEETSLPMSLVPVVDRIVACFDLTDDECTLVSRILAEHALRRRSPHTPVQKLVDAVHAAKAVFS